MSSLPAIVRTVRAERAIFTAFGLIVLVTSFLVATVPPLLASRYDEAARNAVAQVPPTGRDVTLTAFIGGRTAPSPPIRTDAGMRAVAGRIGAATPGPLRAVTGPVEYTVATRPAALPTGAGSHPEQPDNTRKLMLDWDPGVAGRIRYAAGRPPHNPAPARNGRPVIEVGLVESAAAPLRVGVGSELPLALGRDGSPVIVRITGLYRPIAAGDPYWQARSGLAKPLVIKTVALRLVEGNNHIGVGVLDAAGYQAVFDRTDALLDFTWRLPVRPSAFTAGRVDPVANALTRLGVIAGNVALSAPGVPPSPLVSPLRVQSGLTGVLAGFRGQLRTAQAVLSLALAGLFAVAVGVLALVCRLLAERLRTPLVMMRARGASPVQLGGGVGAATFVVSLPAAAAGYGLAVVFAPEPAALPAACAVLAAAVALPAALALRSQARAGDDLAGLRVTARQIVLDALAVVLAVAAVIALRRRGLTTSSAASGTDLFLAMVPVLLGCAAGLLTLRGYPYPLRLAGRLAARSRSAVSFVGIARAARQGTAVALPMIVLLLATAVAGFAGVVDSGLRQAQDRSAWMTVGADARVDGGSQDAAGLARVRRVPGVRDVVPARFVDSASLTSPAQITEVTLVAVDLAAYRRLVAGTPIRLPAVPEGGTGVPALMSPGLTRQLGPGPYQVSAGVIPLLTVRPAGTIGSFPATGRAAGDAIVVVPFRSLGEDALASTMFVRGTKVDPGRLRRAAGGDAIVTTRVAVHDRLTGNPMVAMVRTAFGYGVLVVAGYATLAILLALIIGSSARGQAVSYLRTLGLSQGQARRLAIAELAPGLLCAALAGWAVGLLLPHVVGTAVDLRPYTGGFAGIGYAPDPLMTAALAGGLIVFGGLAIAIDAMISARRRLGTTLRMGART